MEGNQMGLNSTFNFLFRGCEAYMTGKLKEAVSSSSWEQGDSVVGMKVNTEKAMEYLSKYPNDILNKMSDSDLDADCITFIMRLNMSQYRCELMKTELTGEGQSALMVYR
jgi:hypothetical protein